MKGWKRIAFALGILFVANVLIYGIVSVPFWFFFKIGRVMKIVLKLSAISSSVQLLYFMMVQD